MVMLVAHRRKNRSPSQFGEEIVLTDDLGRAILTLRVTSDILPMDTEQISPLIDTVVNQLNLAPMNVDLPKRRG